MFMKWKKNSQSHEAADNKTDKSGIESVYEFSPEMSVYADGVIVGSAIVKIVAKYGKDSVSYVGEYVKEMKDAII